MISGALADFSFVCFHPGSSLWFRKNGTDLSRTPRLPNTRTGSLAGYGSPRAALQARYRECATEVGGLCHGNAFYTHSLSHQLFLFTFLPRGFSLHFPSVGADSIVQEERDGKSIFGLEFLGEFKLGFRETT